MSIKKSSLNCRMSDINDVRICNVDDESRDKLTKMLSELQDKVNHSPALNGGFETLLFKVDKIDESQTKIVQTVESIHNAIYAPDDGLFARIQSVKSTATEEKVELEKQLIQIEAWKHQTEKVVTEHLQDVKLQDKFVEQQQKIDQQQKTIDELSTWKNNVISVGKWISVALGGGTITLGFKLVYDVLITHWK